MKRGQDIALQAGELFIVHHNKPGQKLDAHQHDEHHLFIPIRGRVEIKLPTGNLSCGEGKMAYLPAQLEHEFVSEARAGERLIVLIAGSAWKRRRLYAGGSAVLPAQQLLKELLYFMLLNPRSRAQSSLITTFLEALSETLSTAETLGVSGARKSDRVEEPRLKRALEFLDDNFLEPIKIGDAARAAGLSERSLNRAFAKELAVSPKSYLMNLRIEEAASRLHTGRKSVTEVAFAVGYGSLSAFIEAFRAVKGQLPSDYARRQ